MSGLTLVVIAKEPLPGRAKTRLMPSCTAAEAASLAAAALADTLDVVSRARASRRILALEGQPGAWVPPNMEVIPQPAGGLDVRLDAALAGADGPVLLVGMDTPQVNAELLDVEFADADVLLGPSEDGGFWAIGLPAPQPGLLLGVPMSQDDTCDALRAVIRSRGLRCRDLPTLRDVDTVADAAAVAAAAPHTRFAAAWAACAVGAVGGAA